MAAIKRIFNSIGLAANQAARNIENKQINARADQAAENAQAAADKVTLATADTAGSLSVLKKKMDKYGAEVKEWQGKFDLAKQANNKKLGQAAFKELNRAQERYNTIKSQYDEVKARVDNYMDKAEDAQDAAEDASFKAGQIKDRNQMADAEKGVHDALHGADGTGVNKSLDQLDELVTKKEGRNEALDQMSGASTEEQFKKLQEKAAFDAMWGGESAEPAPADAGMEMNIAK